MRKITPSVILQITLILLVGFNFVAQAQGTDYRTFVPVGTVELFAGSPPDPSTGWLIADGTCLSRTTYATLYAVVGTTFGSCGGSTHFALPDMRGRLPIGAGAGTGLTARTLGQTSGSEAVQLTIDNLPPHTHPGSLWGRNGGATVGSVSSTASLANSASFIYRTNPPDTQLSSGSVTVGNNGGVCPGGGGPCVAAPFSIENPSLVLNYLVWAGTVELDIAADIAITVVVVFPTHTPTPTPTPTLTPTSGPSQTPTFTPSPTGQSIYEIGVEVSGQDVLIRNEVTPGDAAIVGFLAVITILLVVTIILWRLRQ